jgi:cytosine/adenosine deaminase-related metal-dependent hydrolase
MLLRARIVVPIAAPPLEDGAVRVCGDRITAVGRWDDLRRGFGGTVRDLGDVILLPGLVNAHCHLDYTGFAGHLPPPRSFTDWIKGVLALKAGWSFSEYAASWLAGARQLLASGCTTVLDIEAVPELLPEAWSGTPIRIVSALEMTGVRAHHTATEIVDAAVDLARTLSRHPRNRVALSPHAPYSTRRDLLELASAAARRNGWRLTMHVAESDEEFHMIRYANGPMHSWLRAQRGDEDCGVRTPVAHAASAGLAGPDCVFAHVNCIESSDLALLADSGTHVVHCPRSHDYFEHPPFPYEALRAAGVNVCLGTDSLLSVRRRGRDLPRLDLFAEMARFAAAHPGVAPAEVLALATRNAARALGCDGVLGELTPGAAADLIVLPAGGDEREAESAVIHHRSPVTAVMVAGVWETGGPAVDAEPSPASRR